MRLHRSKVPFVDGSSNVTLLFRPPYHSLSSSTVKGFLIFYYCEDNPSEAMRHN